jgi:hypothetical protein
VERLSRGSHQQKYWFKIPTGVQQERRNSACGSISAPSKEQIVPRGVV